VIPLLTILFGLFLAYANGANDNFKGVATLFGSGTTEYRSALGWATVTTFLGSAMAWVLAKGLLVTFTGKGLVPEHVVALKSFSLAVVFAAAATVMVATRLGIPVSTTHALTGALVGAGWLASPSGVNLHQLGSSFFAPLIVSPVLAITMASVLYPILRFIRKRLRVGKETCVCIGTEVIATVPVGTPKAQALVMPPPQGRPTIYVGTATTCRDRYMGTLLGINVARALDGLHFLSSGAVSFARGLNDTPKIAAMLLLGSAFPPYIAVISVAMAIAVGGLINAKRVAETLAHRITTMSTGQGFTANLVTAVIVILASRLGLPVSTTHVACGALFGIGAITGQAHWRTIAAIFAAWVTTLPLAAILGAISLMVFRGWITS